MLPKPEDLSSNARDHVRVGCVESCLQSYCCKVETRKKEKARVQCETLSQKKQGGAQLKKIPLASRGKRRRDREICKGSYDPLQGPCEEERPMDLRSSREQQLTCCTVLQIRDLVLQSSCKEKQPGLSCHPRVTRRRPHGRPKRPSLELHFPVCQAGGARRGGRRLLPSSEGGNKRARRRRPHTRAPRSGAHGAAPRGGSPGHADQPQPPPPAPWR